MSTEPEPSALEQEIEGEYAQLGKLRERIRELRAQLPRETVKDYELTDPDGPVQLSALFGEKTDLIFVHNMGKQCPMCTCWADGLNGLADHLADRGAFVVGSPNTPEEQQAFAQSRGWRFRMVSVAGTTMLQDLQMGDAEGRAYPGVSIFQRDDDGNVFRVGSSYFGPGDDFNPIYHLMDLIPEGHAGWFPKLEY